MLSNMSSLWSYIWKYLNQSLERFSPWVFSYHANKLFKVQGRTLALKLMQKHKLMLLPITVTGQSLFPAKLSS